MNSEMNSGSRVSTRERSASYPSITLQEALDLMGKLQISLGNGPYSREDAAKGMGYAGLSGASAPKVASLNQYGLLERAGTAYTMSKLAQDILFPVSEISKNEALYRAARSPQLFDKLITRYAGQSLPGMLENILMRENIKGAAAKEALNIFKETLTFVGVLVNGVVTLPKQNDSTSQPQESMQGNIEKLRPASREQEHIYDFPGGVRLMLPRSQKIDEAILDGELKHVRKALTEFVEKFAKATDVDE